MASTYLGNNATLGYSLTNGSYTTILEVKSITSNKPAVPIVDVSSLTDTTAIKLPGFVDNGEFSWEMYDNATNSALLGTLIGVVYYYEITAPDTHTIVFQAILKDYEASYERNGAVVWKCSAAITGPVVLT